jgi:hypothetical protein
VRKYTLKTSRSPLCIQTGQSWQEGPKNTRVVRTLCGRSGIPQRESLGSISSPGLFEVEACPRCLAADVPLSDYEGPVAGLTPPSLTEEEEEARAWAKLERLAKMGGM